MLCYISSHHRPIIKKPHHHHGQDARQSKSHSSVSRHNETVEGDPNNDLGPVAASVVSDPGPCCHDWVCGGGWTSCVKPWQSGSGRRY